MLNKYFTRTLIGFSLVLISVIVFLPKKTEAAWNASSIISDAQFIASGTMNEGQIQAFLDSKGGYLASYHIPPGHTDSRGYYNGTLIGVPGKEVDATGWSTAKLIHETTSWYGINPQVILATLEKEQSIVTTKQGSVSDAELARRIRWAMGYAVTDSGIVSVCSTSTNNNPTGSCAGLATQIDWAATAFRNRYNRPNPNFPVGSTVTICYTDGSPDCSPTYISNRATSSLYSYTPYFHGNMLFYNIMGLWFTWEEWERLIYNLTVSSPLVTSESQLSNPDSVVGESASAGFVLLNNNDVPVHLENVGVAARDQYGNNIDFGWYGPITLAARGQAEDSIHFNTPARIEKFSGLHHAWVSFNYQATFYEAASLTGQDTSVYYSNRTPNIKATTLLTVSPSNPIESQAATYSTTVKNYESKRINYNHLGIANRKTGGANSDIGWTGNGYLEPGETKNLSFSKTLNAGDYFAWTSMQVGADFYNVWDGANVNQLPFKVLAQNSALPITANLTLSNNNPAIGEEVTATYSIRNNTWYAVTFGYIGVANRGPNWTNQDFPWQRNVTLQPGATYNVSVKRTNNDVGTYIAWPAYYNQNVWTTGQTNGQDIQKSYSTHVPNIRAISLISLNPTNLVGGQNGTYSTTIKNNEPKGIYLNYLGLANRKLQDNSNSDIGWLTGIYLNSGETKTITLTKALQAGEYFAWSSMGIGQNFYEIWDGANVNQLRFVVR